MKKKLNPAIIELAAKYDRLANEANFDESKHPRSDDGKFTSGGGSSSGKSDGKKQSGGKLAEHEERSQEVKRLSGMWKGLGESALKEINATLAGHRKNKSDKDGLLDWIQGKENRKNTARRGAREVHRAAILAGFKYNPKTHQYE